ncbi:MAG: metallophosphoesterase [Candidatus Freyarchaeum deiterrae]
MEKSEYKAVVVSDVHLGYKAYSNGKEECDKKKFNAFLIKFLKKHSIEYLILLGDMLEFWRRDNETVIDENRDILEQLLSLTNVEHKIYVVGNHDFDLEVMTWPNGSDKDDTINKRGLNILKNMNVKNKKQYFEYIPDEYVLPPINGKNFKFIHGYQLTELGYPILRPLYEDLYLCLCSLGEDRGRIASEIWDFFQQLKKKLTDLPVSKLIEKGKLGTKGFHVMETKSPELFKEINGLKPKQKEQLLESTILESLGEEGFKELCNYTLLSPEERVKTQNPLEELFKKELRQGGVFQYVSPALGIDVSELVNEYEKEIKYYKKGMSYEEKLRSKYENVFGKKLGKDDYLVFGHTHVPIDPNKGNLVANAACWLTLNPNCYLTIDSKGDLKLYNY